MWRPPPAFPSRPSRSLHPRALLMTLPYPILSCMSRLRSTALRLAPGRAGGAAAPRWARESIRGEGWLLAGEGAKMPFGIPIRQNRNLSPRQGDHGLRAANV